MDEMQAAFFREHGGPEVLRVGAVTRPEPAASEVCVRVSVCALNALDVLIRRGLPGRATALPHVSGGDIAGTVAAAGAGASARLGERVLVDPAVPAGAIGEDAWGGLAEYVNVPADNLIRLPAGVDDLGPYAALPVAYGTAYRMLYDRAVLRAGETVVVLGAAGGVGVACVQLSKAIGARVIACSADAGKRSRLLELGADAVVDASAADWSAQAWKLTDRGADVVIDYVGEATWNASVRLTRRSGRLVTCGAISGFEATTDLRYVWTRELDILGSDGWTRDGLEALVAQVREGSLLPVVSSRHPLADARNAVAQVEDRLAFGKVLVDVGAPS